LKQYIGAHSVDYNGTFDGETIKGKWSIGGTSDKFKITKKLNVITHKPYLKVALP